MLHRYGRRRWHATFVWWQPTRTATAPRRSASELTSETPVQVGPSASTATMAPVTFASPTMLAEGLQRTVRATSEGRSRPRTPIAAT